MKFPATGVERVNNACSDLKHSYFGFNASICQKLALKIWEKDGDWAKFQKMPKMIFS